MHACITSWLRACESSYQNALSAFHFDKITYMVAAGPHFSIWRKILPDTGCVNKLSDKENIENQGRGKSCVVHIWLSRRLDLLSFSLWLQSPKKGDKTLSLVLRAVIWHFFLDIWGKVKTFLRWSHLYTLNLKDLGRAHLFAN